MLDVLDYRLNIEHPQQLHQLPYNQKCVLKFMILHISDFTHLHNKDNLQLSMNNIFKQILTNSPRPVTAASGKN